MKLPRADSLFTRLLLLQIGVAIALATVFAAIVYVERNVAVARLVAERWAPALLHAAALPGAPALAPQRVPLRSEARPAQGWRPSLAAPRMAALADEFERHGLRFDDALIARGPGGPVLWCRSAPATAAAPGTAWPMPRCCRACPGACCWRW